MAKKNEENKNIQKLEVMDEKNTPLPGLEPGIFSLGGKHLIHWATGAVYFFIKINNLNNKYLNIFKYIYYVSI